MQGTTAPPFRSDRAHTTSLLIYRQNQKLLGDAGHLRSYCTPNYKRILLGQGLPLGTAATGQVIHVLRDHPGPWHPGPHPLDARSTPSRDHHRCRQTLPSVPGGGGGGWIQRWLRITGLGRKKVIAEKEMAHPLGLEKNPQAFQQ